MTSFGNSDHHKGGKRDGNGKQADKYKPFPKQTNKQKNQNNNNNETFKKIYDNLKKNSKYIF